jgi:hypothetical protein
MFKPHVSEKVRQRDANGRNAKITVIDSYKGTLGTVTATDTQPLATQTFTYDRKLAPLSSGCTKVNNTATIVETGQSSSASANDCNTGAHQPRTAGSPTRSRSRLPA